MNFLRKFLKEIDFKTDEETIATIKVRGDLAIMNLINPIKYHLLRISLYTCVHIIM